MFRSGYRIICPVEVANWMGLSQLTIHRPPPSVTLVNLRLLQIRILHLRKRREKMFPTIKMFLVLKLQGFKVANLPFMDLVVF